MKNSFASDPLEYKIKIIYLLVSWILVLYNIDGLVAP